MCDINMFENNQELAILAEDSKESSKENQDHTPIQQTNIR